MNFLQKNKAELIQRAEWMAEQTNDLQTIKAYMSARMGNISMTETQQAKLKRWQYIYDQLSGGKFGEQDVRQQLMKHFGVSDFISYQDMREAKEVFSTTLNLNKQFEIEIDIKLLKLMMRKAQESNNLDAFAKLQKAKTELYKLIPDVVERPIDYFEPRQNIMQYNPELLGIDKMPEDRLKELFTQLKTEFGFEDIDYEMIEDK